MMRLKKSTGPETLDIGKLGVTLTVRPNGTAMMEDARNDPLLIEERAAIMQEHGVEASDALPMHVAARIMHRAIARAAIIDWSGVIDDETGETVNPSPEAINAAMDNDRFNGAFVDLYIVPAFQVELEKNG